MVHVQASYDKILLVFSGSHICLLYALLCSISGIRVNLGHKIDFQCHFCNWLVGYGKTWWSNTHVTVLASPLWLKLDRLFCFWSQKRPILGVANIEFCEILKVCNYLTNHADVLKFFVPIVNLVTFRSIIFDLSGYHSQSIMVT